MKTARFLLVVVWTAPFAAVAIDAPHDLSYSPTFGCPTCHVPHAATGGALTTEANNVLICNNCHQNQTGFGFPWADSYQAVPGVEGRSHRWDASPTNATYGAQMPAHPELTKRIFNGHFMCSTCHNQHVGATLNGGTQHVAPVTVVAGGAGGSMTVAGVPPGSVPKGYLIEIVTAGAVGASRFRISHDSGGSWYGWDGANWVPGLAAGKPTGNPVELDVAGVQVSFTGSQAVGDRWKFYVSYPFPRILNTSSQLCEACHVQRVQTAAYNESGGDGVKVFSHPVGEQLTKGYDRAPTALLDANGGIQDGAGADAIVTNDLELDPTGRVRCMTCHHPHNADSNSLTEDLR